MCDCGKQLSRRDVIIGAGMVGVAALAGHVVGATPVEAQADSPLEIPVEMLVDREVELQPPPPPFDEKDIVRIYEQPDTSQVNGFSPESVEPTERPRAAMEARDLHLASLKKNEQGDIKFALRGDN